MIHEYALEPELVATWGNRHDFRYFIERFGLGQPRIVSRYPKPWKRLVWEAFHSDDDMEKLRMTELLTQLSERMVQRRNYLWEPGRIWIQNAHEENARVPFHAILARENSSEHPRTMTADGLVAGTSLWKVPRGVASARSAVEMAAAVGAMLRIADVVIFVDPYFRPGELKSRRPLEAFLRAVMAGRPMNAPSRIEVHTSLTYEKAPKPSFFLSECERQLPWCIPQGMQMSVLILSEKAGGERLHNRYILTDVGGLMFGIGLDDGAAGETDDVTLLDRPQYELRWSQHSSETMAFDVPELPLEIRSRP